MLVDPQKIRPCEDLKEEMVLVIHIERQLQRKSSSYTKSKFNLNVTTLVEISGKVLVYLLY